MRTQRLAALRLSHLLPLLLLLLGGVLVAKTSCRVVHPVEVAACRDAGGGSQDDAGSPPCTPENDSGGASGNAFAEVSEGLAKRLGD
jgi:hypothetical protein